MTCGVLVRVRVDTLPQASLRRSDDFSYRAPAIEIIGESHANFGDEQNATSHRVQRERCEVLRQADSRRDACCTDRAVDHTAAMETAFKVPEEARAAEPGSRRSQRASWPKNAAHQQANQRRVCGRMVSV